MPHIKPQDDCPAQQANQEGEEGVPEAEEGFESNGLTEKGLPAAVYRKR